MLNWGVIGLGRIAQRFCDSLSHFDEACFYAGASRNPEKRQQFKELYHPEKLYDDYIKLLEDENVDIVYIALPHASHYHYALEAMKHHKAVLVEKPATLTSKEIRTLCEYSEKNHVFFMEAMKSRFIPMINQVHKEIDKGIIGDIVSIENHFQSIVPYNEQSYIYDPKQGGALYDTGIIKIDGGTVKDWNQVGFGRITFDKGFEYSSNTGAINLMRKFITKDELKECYNKYGFGFKTGVELARELPGKISFNYDLEVANASFGQGITTTPIQHLQSLSIIANNGKKITPYVVDKIVDPNTGKTVYEGKKDGVQVVSASTTNKMKELMRNVIEGKDVFTTGTNYYKEGLGLIGKTGTAEFWDSSKGSYATGIHDYIYSFAGMFPYDDPEIIIYAAMKKPEYQPNQTLSKLVKDIASDTSKYLNISTDDNKTLNSYVITNYYNKNIDDVTNDLISKKLNVYVIGDGDRVINQYPRVNRTIVEGDLVILKTNSTSITVPSFINLSYKEANELCNMMNASCNFTGNGYIKEQSIPEGTLYDKESIIELTLE